MSWIKRNLYFLIGGGVAVALLGLAGFYFYSKWALNKENLEKLEAAYTDWEQISNLNPSPGNDKIDNIKLAREQREQVRAMIQKVAQYLASIPPIPNPDDGVVTKGAFASSLRRTIDQLQKDAASSGVTLQPKYDFSFQAERNLPNFAPGSLGPLSTQLGDIRAICNVLFAAKLNSLDSLRRERVSTDDLGGPQTDYLEPNHISITNELAVLAPYEITFHCFSTELAGVLAGFANDTHGLLVKAVNIESGSGMTVVSPDAMGGFPPGFAPPVAPGAGAASTTRGALPTVLDEKQLRVSLVLDVVKLLPRKN